MQLHRYRKNFDIMTADSNYNHGPNLKSSVPFKICKHDSIFTKQKLRKWCLSGKKINFSITLVLSSKTGSEKIFKKKTASQLVFCICDIVMPCPLNKFVFIQGEKKQK